MKPSNINEEKQKLKASKKIFKARSKEYIQLRREINKKLLHIITQIVSEEKILINDKILIEDQIIEEIPSGKIPTIDQIVKNKEEIKSYTKFKKEKFSYLSYCLENMQLNDSNEKNSIYVKLEKQDKNYIIQYKDLYAYNLDSDKKEFRLSVDIRKIEKDQVDNLIEEYDKGVLKEKDNVLDYSDLKLLGEKVQRKINEFNKLENMINDLFKTIIISDNLVD